MIVYFSIFFVVFIYFLYENEYSQIQGKKSNLSKHLFVFLMVATGLFVGLGDMIGGYDRYIYGAVFDGIADELSRDISDKDILTSRTARGTEYGYLIWNIIIGHVSSNRYMFIFLTVIVTYLMYMHVFLNVFDRYSFVFVLFLGFLFYFTITYMRQCFSVAIAWYGIEYVRRRRFFPFVAIVLIASSIHNSAFVFLLLYFIPIRRHSKIHIFSFLFLCLLLGLTPIPSLLISSSDSITGAMGRNYADEMGGFGYMYLVEIVFLLVCFSFLYRFYPADRKSLVFLNTFLLYCGALLFFIRFSQGGRMGWYFLIGVFYFFDNSIYKQRLKVYRYIGVFVSFLLFSRITYYWAFNLTPYTTFLTNGYPAGERRIYYTYEWDENYKENKMYRPMIDFK